MTTPSGHLPVGFDLVDRLRTAAICADDMIIDDVVAILREAATAIEALRAEVRGIGLAGAEPAGRA